jgi:PAS domain S-box-containing protein
MRLPAAVERALQEAEAHKARRNADQEIQHQRTFLRQVIDLDRNRIFAKDRDGHFTLANQAVADAYGISVEGLIGKTNADLVHDREQAERLLKIDRQVLDSQTELFIPEMQMADAAGRVRWFQVTKRPFISADGRADMVVSVATDITERKLHELRIGRLNRILSVLSGINSAIVRIRNRQELFKEACRIAVEHGGFGMAWIGSYDPAAQEVTPVAWAGLEASEYLGGVKAIIRDDLPQGRGVLARAIRSRKLVFDNDITVDRAAGGKRRAEAIRRGYRSVIVLPLIVEGEVMGSLSLFAKELNYFDDEELKLLTELAGDVSFALEHIAGQERIEKLSRVRAVSSSINAAIVRIREREDLLKETCRIASEEGKFEMVWIGMLDLEQKQVRAVAWAGFSDETARQVDWATIEGTQGSIAEAIRTKKVAMRNDV